MMHFLHFLCTPHGERERERDGGGEGVESEGAREREREREREGGGGRRNGFVMQARTNGLAKRWKCYLGGG